MVGKKTSRGRDFRKECWRYGIRLLFFFCLSWRHIVHRSMRTGKKEERGFGSVGFRKAHGRNDSVMCAITMDYEYDVRCITCIDKKQ